MLFSCAQQLHTKCLTLANANRNAPYYLTRGHTPPITKRYQNSVRALDLSNVPKNKARKRL